MFLTETLLSSQNNVYKFEKFSVEDNGIGLNEANYNRLITLRDESKMMSNKGTGGIQFIHFFDETKIQSTYEQKAKSFRDIEVTLSKKDAFLKNNSIVRIDKNEDTYYQTLSGLQKSIRGSDVDASLHYLALLLSSEDLLSLSRRLQIIAYEDIGLANPQLAPRVRAACETALDVGLPEAIIPLGVIVCDMALSPKSNSGYLGIHKALEDIENGKCGNLPPHLKNTYSFDGKVDSYKYPHDYPGSWVYQQYLPDEIKDAKYYEPKESSKYEIALKERYEKHIRIA